MHFKENGSSKAPVPGDSIAWQKNTYKRKRKK